SFGRLHYLPRKGGFRVELRKLGDALVTDDRLGHGLKLVPGKAGQLRIDKETYTLGPPGVPDDPPAKWTGLIGEYGPEHCGLTVLEKDGKLHALIEWFFLYPLEEESADVFRFPDEAGLYHGEKLVFTRDRTGKATRVLAAGVALERRRFDGEGGK